MMGNNQKAIRLFHLLLSDKAAHMSNNKYSDISQMGGNSLFLTAPAKDSEIIPKDISATLRQAAEILPRTGVESALQPTQFSIHPKQIGAAMPEWGLHSSLGLDWPIPL